MKRLLLVVFLAVLPFVALAAPQSITATVDSNANPADAGLTNHLECRAGAVPLPAETVLPFVEIPAAAAPNGQPMNATVNANLGDRIECRAWATKTGRTDSARTGVAFADVPLGPVNTPQNLRLQLH